MSVAEHVRGSEATDTSDVPDEVLVARVRAGEQGAFAVLYHRHAPRLARLLRGIAGSAQGVDDMLQTTFLEAHRSLDRYSETRPFRAWLNGVAVHVARRGLRERARRWWQWLTPPETMATAHRAHEAGPEAQAVTGELAADLYQAMDALAPGMRAMFALHDIEGMGVTEIATACDSTPQAVWMQVQRARQRLRKQLARRWRETPPRKEAGS